MDEVDRRSFERAVRRCPLLAGLDLADAERAARVFEPFRFRTGDVLVRVGERGRALAVVLSGALLLRVRRGDRAWTLSELGPGDTFGERGFFDEPTPAPLEVVARTDGLLAVLPRSAWDPFARSRPDVAARIEGNALDGLARSLRAMDERIAELLAATRPRGPAAALLQLLFPGGSR